LPIILFAAAGVAYFGSLSLLQPGKVDVLTGANLPMLLRILGMRDQELAQLAQNAKSLWDGSANPEEFPSLALATDWGFAAARANKNGGKWLIASPKEGGTAWIDYWCITRAAKGMKKQFCREK